MASSNNTYDTATVLTDPSGRITGLSNVGAGVEAGEPDSNRGNSLWFVFKLTESVSSVVFRQGITSGSADLYMLLYGMPRNPSKFSGWYLAASNDDSAGSGSALISLPTLSPGFYALKWASYSSATTSAGTLDWSGLSSIDPNYSPNIYEFYPAAGLRRDTYRSVVGAHVIPELLDRWYTHPTVPVSENSLTAWLAEDSGYVKPPPSSGGGDGPTPMPASGRGWPR